MSRSEGEGISDNVTECDRGRGGLSWSSSHCFLHKHLWLSYATDLVRSTNVACLLIPFSVLALLFLEASSIFLHQNDSGRVSK